MAIASVIDVDLCALICLPSAMQTKTCSRCAECKDFSFFHRNRSRQDGFNSHCKQCEKARFKAIYEANQKLRAITAERATKWAKENREARLAIEKRRNIKNKERWPEKHKARAAVHARVYTGKMPPPSSLACVECGGSAAHYHHHKGYDHAVRYDVVPVCPACHYVLDRLVTTQDTAS